MSPCNNLRKYLFHIYKVVDYVDWVKQTLIYFEFEIIFEFRVHLQAALFNSVLLTSYLFFSIVTL